MGSPNGFTNGSETLSFLTDKSRNDGHKSFLLLLDIRMPQMDGIEVLKRMKNSPDIQDIPVIMLTTTDDPREVKQCYQLGCNAYVTKPVEFGKFAETLHRLGLFLQVVKV